MKAKPKKNTPTPVSPKPEPKAAKPVRKTAPAAKAPKATAPRKATPKAPKPSQPAPTPASGARRVRLEVTLGSCGSVCLTGSFNGWSESGISLAPLGDGRWAAEVELVPGEYEYLFIADGRWLPDPAAAAWVPNPFGGVNSILRVA